MKLIDRIKTRILHFTWDLAYGEYDDSIITDGFDWKKLHIIKNPYEKKKWFADPFILGYNDLYLDLLVEEFDFEVKRGRIARLVIDKNSDTIKECHIVLDLETHLSFPAIYRMGSEVWVHPENSASGKSYIYRYNRLNDELCDKTLLVDAPLTDPIIHKVKGKYQIVATMLPDPNGNQLHVYETDDFFGPYGHQQTSKLPRKNARMAGNYIELHTKDVVRPSQDCDEDYGKAVLFEKEGVIIGKLAPTGVKYAGLHTFNAFGDWFVIDLKKYDYPLIYDLKEKLKWRKK